MDDAILINKLSNKLKMNTLFAIDTITQEVIVSESQKGSKKINLIERIARKENVVLYDAVVTLTSITNASYFDTKIFKSMDKVCQMIYNQHKEKQ